MTRFIVLAYCEAAQETELAVVLAASSSAAEAQLAQELGDDWCVLGAYLPEGLASIVSDAMVADVPPGGSVCLDTLVSS